MPKARPPSGPELSFQGRFFYREAEERLDREKGVDEWGLTFKQQVCAGSPSHCSNRSTGFAKSAARIWAEGPSA